MKTARIYPLRETKDRHVAISQHSQFQLEEDERQAIYQKLAPGPEEYDQVDEPLFDRSRVASRVIAGALILATGMVGYIFIEPYRPIFMAWVGL